MNNDEERESLHNRLTNKDKSKQSEFAWKRYHASYMRGIRKRERNKMNRTFYDVSKDLEQKMNESEITKDNVFDKQLDIAFKNIAGGISFSINKDTGLISFSVSMNQNEDGNGSYKLAQATDEIFNNLYESIKEDLTNLCDNFDNELNQIISKNGLKSTK